MTARLSHVTVLVILRDKQNKQSDNPTTSSLQP